MTFDIRPQGRIYRVFYKGRMLGRISKTGSKYRALGKAFDSLQDALDEFRRWYGEKP
jgi:hypothetical protein